MVTTDRLFESIHSVYSNKSRQNTTEYIGKFDGISIASIKYRILSNTAKYCMGASLYGFVDKYTDLLCLQNVSTYHMTEMLFSHHFIAIDTV